MKIRLYFLALFAAIQLPIHAQNSFPLIGDTGTYWLQGTVCNWGGNCIFNDDYALTINGSHTSNNQTYFKIKEEWHQTAHAASGWPNACHLVNNSGTTDFLFGMREDSGKVYFYDVIQDEEFLMYDFTAQIGDSVPEAFNQVMRFEVVDIDSVLVNSAYRKRWILSENGQPTPGRVIEGIGNDLGLTLPIGSTFECGYHLDCYGENNQTIYPDTSTNCVTNIGHLSLQEQNPLAHIAPQYQANDITIPYPPNLQNATFELYNTSGKLLKQGNFNKEIHIQNEQFSAGIYILRIKTISYQTVLKLVVHGQ